MMKQWSIDRTKDDYMFQHKFETDSFWSLSYTWLKENGIIFKIQNMENYFIVFKVQYKHLIDAFQNILSNNNFLTYNFDEAANIMSHVYWVVINNENWDFSTCTCSIFQKNYFCNHVTSVAVSLNLTKIPPNCKNLVNIGEKAKRGRIPNALKGLQKQ